MPIYIGVEEEESRMRGKIYVERVVKRNLDHIESIACTRFQRAASLVLKFHSGSIPYEVNDHLISGSYSMISGANFASFRWDREI